ncbi:hypothetical protein Tsp_06771 [Trichinella spiralis]|nr:hypothetical protein Tsp_06771 [Trichinella spiralis]
MIIILHQLLFTVKQYIAIIIQTTTFAYIFSFETAQAKRVVQ